jgi:hypothetical protein
MLTLLSACQHGMPETLEFCMAALLTEHNNQQDLREASAHLSLEFKSCGLTLLPVPFNVIKAIIPTACRECTATQKCIKFH